MINDECQGLYLKWFGQKQYYLSFNSTFGKGCLKIDSFNPYLWENSEVFQNEGRKYSFEEYGEGYNEKNHPDCTD
jgi:hypothetical protein